MKSSASAEAMEIGALARLSGCPASTIRYYERVGILPLAPRVGGRRRYRAEAVMWVTVVRLGRRLGFSVHELQLLLRGDREAVAVLTHRRDRAITAIRKERCARAIVDRLLSGVQGSGALRIEAAQCRLLRRALANAARGGT